MKRKGFTLIELLAVIVVLAIIALIATPIVMNTIKNAKKGTIKNSIENYVKAVEYAALEKKKNSNDSVDGIYSVDSEGNLCKEGDCNNKIIAEVNGKKPTSGVIKIANGTVAKIVGLTIDDNFINKTDEEEFLSVDSPICTASKVLTNTDAGSLATSEEDMYNYGIEYKCDPGDGKTRTFYVLKVTDKLVYLLMDRNLSNNVTLSPDGTNKNGPVYAMEQLNEKTATWNKVLAELPPADLFFTAAGKDFNKYRYYGERLLPYVDTRYKYFCTNLKGCSGNSSCIDDGTSVANLRGFYTSTTFNYSTNNTFMFALSYNPNSSSDDLRTVVGWTSFRTLTHGVRPLIVLNKERVSLN